MKRLLLLLTTALLVVGAGNYITAQQSGSGVPGGSSFSTQYKLNPTTFGGAGPGTSGQVLTSNGSSSAPTFQAAAGGTPCTTAAGAVQYNSSGAFGCEAAFVYDSSTNVLSLDNLQLNVQGTLGVKSGTSVSYGTLRAPLANGVSGYRNVLEFVNYASSSSNRSGSFYLGTELPASFPLLTNPSQHLNGTGIIAIGDGAGLSITTGDAADDIFIGTHAGRSTTNGNDNVFVGTEAGRRNVLGANNVYVGWGAGAYGVDSSHSIGIGNSALGTRDGNGNTAVGDNALSGSGSAAELVGIGNYACAACTDQSVAIGTQAGQFASGAGNLFLGWNAGANAVGDNQLYIANTNTATPLIYGVFPNTSVTINGELITKASSTGGAGLNIPAGTAPTSPVNGDVWTTTAGLFARINGATVGPFATGNGTVTVGTFTVTYPVACSTTPTQNWAYIQTSNGTNTTTTVYPTDQVSCTSDSTGFNNTGGTQVPAGQRPIQEVVFNAGSCASIGVNGSCVIRFGTNGSVTLGNSAFDYNGAWGATGEKDFPATNLGFPSFTYRTN